MATHARPYRHLDQCFEQGHSVRPVAVHSGQPWGLATRLLAGGPGRLVDRVAVKAIEAIVMSRGQPDTSGDVRARIDEMRARYSAPQLLRQPRRYFQPMPDPPGGMHTRRLGRLPGGQRLELTFRSPYRTFDPAYQPLLDRFEGNETNRVWCWLHRGGGRPAVICIHTWCGGVLTADEQIFAARALYRRGFDVALFTLPFHGSRTPRQARFPGQIFPNRDLRRTNEGFGQAVADLRALMTWLRGPRRCSDVGVMGMSLGGYTAALLASLHRELAFCVPIVAPASMADVLWYHGAGRPGRQEAEDAGFTLQDFRAIWSVHCPLSYRVMLPRERLLLIWGEQDVIVPAAHQLALWEHWGRPQLRAFPGAHLLQVGRRDYLRWILRWLQRWV